ncbi:ABC transporter permease subunit [Labrys wisconsinensis]|uniref:Putrescine transport system permease protein n=1 Tax=Labrys wisconsinensis TaxID=425677 RepID=A0ABU0JPP2_9HYPH|nr:ABC transporter permease subunit [Labrys wisconsinensis]MDQ0475348.1 putrescine transport system permease protein [Labrys wisconsinensis]
MSKPAFRDRFRISWKAPVAGIPYLWLLLFFLAPFLIVLKISIADGVVSLPPYTPLWSWNDDGSLAIRLQFGNYHYFIKDPLYIIAYLNSLKIAAISTVLCLLVAYPIALAIARSSPTGRSVYMLLIILPFWTSFVLRIYAWMGLLNRNGLINAALMHLGLIDQPITMMNTDFAVYLGIVYSYLPFMVLPIYVALEKMDASLLEAAGDLGSRPWQVFRDVTLPLSMPGVIAGSLLVFIPATGEYVIPALLGSPGSPMIGRVLFDEFYVNRDWPVASAVAVVLVLILVAPILWFQRAQMRQAEAGR